MTLQSDTNKSVRTVSEKECLSSRPERGSRRFERGVGSGSFAPQRENPQRERSLFQEPVAPPPPFFVSQSEWMHPALFTEAVDDAGLLRHLLHAAN